MPAVPPGATNRPNYAPPALTPGDPIPGGPTTTIPKRPALPPDDKGTRFERRPDGAASTASAIDVTQDAEFSMPLPTRAEKRLFRQSVSAGFHTQVLTAQNDRTGVGRNLAQSSRLKARGQAALASSE